MSVDLVRLRRFAPLAVFAATVGLGWILLAGPVLADRAKAADRLALLKQQETALQAMVTAPAPSIAATDPLEAFDRRIATDDSTPYVVERLAQLASDMRARSLLIETVEAPNSTGRGAPVAGKYQPDPRFALFDRQLTYSTIKMSFESDYAGLGRLLWNLRDLPSIVEVRTLNVQPRESRAHAPSSSARASGTVRTSITLFAYSRILPSQVNSRTVTP
jgi:hypothetical protein